MNQTLVVSGYYSCPETHYLCPEGYCVPVFTRCNGVYDCPDKQDEVECDNYQCPGYYRCRGSPTCIHPSHFCDGMYHCPQHDDELFCDLHCPTVCTCHGLAFTCPGWFSADQYPDLKYLQARGSGVKMEQLTSNVKLVYLSLASCQLSALGNFSFPNLVTLDLSDNYITSLTNIIQDMINLHSLFISNNPLSDFLQEDASLSLGGPDVVLGQVNVLYLSRISFPIFSLRIGRMFPGVRRLNASECGTRHIMEHSMGLMVHLHTLDMTGCTLADIQKNTFKGLTQLREVYADNYKICCSTDQLKTFDINGCHAPQNELSSCSDLLRFNVYRGMLITFSFLSILGNIFSGAFRLMTGTQGRPTGFKVFIFHLCVSDLLMGLYLAVIGVADRIYQNIYVWQDMSWRHSATCQLAGFLAMLSSEVSASVICLITLDRFLAVGFPLKFLSFNSVQAQLVNGLCWVIGILLAAIPFFPRNAHWDFYSQTGICIPLPITRKQFPGHMYAFSIMIVLNLVLFLIIAFGQISIFFLAHQNRMSGNQTSRRSQDASIARRLFSIAVSDFLCWFPIGLLGVLAFQGVPVPGEVNVAIAIFVLPLNSAINPFLYTLNVMLEKRRQANEDRLLKWIETQN